MVNILIEKKCAQIDIIGSRLLNGLDSPPLSLAISYYHNFVLEKAPESKLEDYRNIMRLMVQAGANIHQPVKNMRLRAESWFPIPYFYENPQGSPLNLAKTLQLDEIVDLLMEESLKLGHLDNMDHYEILGIAKTATEEDIRAAYKKKARIYHPDKNLDNQAKASQIFQAIKNSYAILSDPKLRASYDLDLYLGLS